MQPDLLAIARQHLAHACSVGGEKGDKAEKPAAEIPLSPLSPFSPPGGTVGEPPTKFRPDWGCHRDEMLRLLAGADEYVERSGVSGRHPIIQAAADMVVSATATHDIETLRYAVAEFRAAVASVIAARE